MHSLPSGDEIATFTAFFRVGRVMRSGEVILELTLPVEMKAVLLDLSGQENMAMNFTAWATELPDEMTELARVVGLGDLVGKEE